MNSQDILKKLPDFDDLSKLTEEIAKVSANKLFIENKIKLKEAETVRRVTTETQFFQNGKPPSMAYIEATYKYTGADNEIISIRDELAKTTAQLEALKTRMEIYKQLFDIWRTLSANERHTTL